MSRVDVPTLRCDRCKATTQNMKEMASWPTLTRYHIGGQDTWDLCSVCWDLFIVFILEGDK